jgi:hypothetical protein
MNRACGVVPSRSGSRSVLSYPLGGPETGAVRAHAP